ncbi:MAG: pyridoxamine 5'-phosphate oxidase [Wenzhouxiangella sp.]
MSRTLPMTPEMVTRFREGMQRAREAEIPEPTGMTLTTVDESGQPRARTVLLKDMDADGFVFYTNLESRKGRDLAFDPRVGLLFWWRETAEQVIVEGRAEPVAPEVADAYFASRPRGSQIGAWASRQSQALDSRQTLIDRVSRFEREFDGRDVPRPDHWSGFLVRPHRVEFWYGREYRLHERHCFELRHGHWQRQMLYP